MLEAQMIRQLRLVGVLTCAVLAGCGQQDQQADDPAAQVASKAPARPAAFAMCASCHSVSPGRHGAGPSLAGIWGKKAASAPGYAYSPALKGSGIVWDAQTLDRWLQGPMQMVPGTRMVVGLPNPEARQTVIAYIQQLK
jgi:cytochrome c